MRYWVVGEFGSGDEAKKALRRLGELGYAKETLDAFSPYPVEGIEEVLELNLATGVPIVYEFGPELRVLSKKVLDG